MPRMPHEMRRTSLLSSGYELRGPLLSGHLEAPSHGHPGFYQGKKMRLLYRRSHDDPGHLDVRSPSLAHAGDVLRGEVAWGKKKRTLWVQGRGTGEAGATFPIMRSGWLGGRRALYDPAGQPLALARKQGAVWYIEIMSAPFDAVRESKSIGKQRVLEAAIAMFAIGLVEQDRKRRQNAAAVAAGASAGAGAAAAGVRAYRRHQAREAQAEHEREHARRSGGTSGFPVRDPSARDKPAGKKSGNDRASAEKPTQDARTGDVPGAGKGRSGRRDDGGESHGR